MLMDIYTHYAWDRVKDEFWEIGIPQGVQDKHATPLLSKFIWTGKIEYISEPFNLQMIACVW